MADQPAIDHTEPPDLAVLPATVAASPADRRVDRLHLAEVDAAFNAIGTSATPGIGAATAGARQQRAGHDDVVGD